MHPHVRTLILLPILALARTLHSQSAPQVLHTQLTTESASNGIAPHIEAVKRANRPTWIGYSVALIPGLHLDSNYSGTLDLNNEGNSYRRTDDDPIATPTQAVLLLHIDQGVASRIRLVDPARVLDAGDQPFLWLTSVSPADSIQFLATLARAEAETGQRKDRVRSSALFALAAHSAPQATTALIALIEPSNPIDLRDKAAFWLANQRGAEGFAALQKYARNDPSDDFRKKLTFDLTLTKEPAALDELIRMAHSDSSPEVRKQAQFWMANKGGKKVGADLGNIAANDPNSEVRKSAVFAISRLPDGESTTRLIELAGNSKDPAVRKQAVFWLGQSKDPHALDYLTSLIKQ
jgi:hypothetical protein